MSRFVGAQSLAFQKLLKKYRKWTGSTTLTQRFREEVLDRPGSFSKRDFQPLLSQWTEVLAYVRAPFEEGAKAHHEVSQAIHETTKPNGTAQNPPYHAPDKSSITGLESASELCSIWESGSIVEMDTALAVVPLGPKATKAEYWIHIDNIVQIHVLLLQYTRLQRSIKSSSPLETPPSSRTSPRGSLSANGNKECGRKGEEVGTIVCDDLQEMAKRFNSDTVIDSEARPGTVPEKALASIRYSSSSEAVVAVGTRTISKDTTSPAKLRSHTAKVDRKLVSRLFKAPQNEPGSYQPISSELEQVCTWLLSHPEVRPLVQLEARRTRFVGLKNSKAGGIWATLNRDVLMRSVSQHTTEELVPLTEHEGTDSKSFPHAILEVRTEGDIGNDLIAKLDGSHLVFDPVLVEVLELANFFRLRGSAASRSRLTP